MWDHLSLLSFLLVGCPESRPEEPITANTLTAHLFSGLLRDAWLSPCQVKEWESWKTTNPYPLVHREVRTPASHHASNPHSLYMLNLAKELVPTQEGTRRAKWGDDQFRAHLFDVSHSFVYIISGSFQSARIQTANTLLEFALKIKHDNLWGRRICYWSRVLGPGSQTKYSCSALTCKAEVSR